MKKWQVAAVSIALVGSLGACGKGSDAPSASSIQSNSESTNQVNEEKKPIKTEQRKEIADAFVGTYNERYDPDIAEVSYYNPQDKESGHYRTEFRLGAWKDSVGLHGICGSCDVDLTVYRNDQARAYASGPLDEIEKVFGSLVKTFDESVSDEQIADAIDKAENKIGGGNGLRIDGSNIEPMIFSVKGENAEIMIDGKFSTTQGK